MDSAPRAGAGQLVHLALTCLYQLQHHLLGPKVAFRPRSLSVPSSRMPCPIGSSAPAAAKARPSAERESDRTTAANATAEVLEGKSSVMAAEHGVALRLCTGTPRRQSRGSDFSSGACPHLSSEDEDALVAWGSGQYEEQEAAGARAFTGWAYGRTPARCPRLPFPRARCCINCAASVHHPGGWVPTAASLQRAERLGCVKPRTARACGGTEAAGGRCREEVGRPQVRLPEAQGRAKEEAACPYATGELLRRRSA